MTSPTAEDGCLFCGIAAGDVPADVVARTDRVVAFRDVAPQAPVHVLVVPVDHHRDVSALAAADPALLGEVARTASAVAAAEGDGQYRLVFNTGTLVGQSVWHVHAHLLDRPPHGLAARLTGVGLRRPPLATSGVALPLTGPAGARTAGDEGRRARPMPEDSPSTPTDRPATDPSTTGRPPAASGSPSSPVAPDGAARGSSVRHTIVVSPDVPMVALLGPRDELLRVIERAFPRTDVHVRGNEVTATGSPGDIALVERLLDELLVVVTAGQALTPDAVERAIGMLRAQTAERPADVLTMNVLSGRGRSIRAKTLGQKRYVEAIDSHTIVFGIGPAGTGKTYLAMAKAVQALQAKQVNRIILTRPAVEAGERLGFLPGTLTEKIDPYLRPLYDALHDMVDPDSIPRLMASGTIEVAPLAYMRGRTLNDAFIILDEAQNTSAEQMKMFLTRLGFASKMVVTGDVTQVDLPSGTTSGLRVVQQILHGVDDVHFSTLTSGDVVRHRLVSDIVDAYGRWDAAQAEGGPRVGSARRR